MPPGTLRTVGVVGPRYLAGGVVPLFAMVTSLAELSEKELPDRGQCHDADHQRTECADDQKHAEGRQTERREQHQHRREDDDPQAITVPAVERRRLLPQRGLRELE